MKRLTMFSVVALLLCSNMPRTEAHRIQLRLFINRGLFTTVDSAQFPYLSFNTTKVFNPRNEVIRLRTTDTLVLTVVNNDTATHGFAIQEQSLSGQVLPQDSLVSTLSFSREGVYIYFDNLQYPVNRYMGLAGMICVNNHVDGRGFFWNIKEHQKAFNQAIPQGSQVNWQTYYPDYFTINGKSHPDLQNDSSARVLANVGDTVYIYIANTGQAKHAIHFHGFHSRVLFSSAGYIQAGTVKETYPLSSMQCVLLEMVPDKTGLYSVHDHNLVAVSGGGKHPNGMFIIMKID